MRKISNLLKPLQFTAAACCALLLSSCMHKDVMSDPADDVKQSLIYSGKEGTFVITHELIFQATSKSSGRGITTISGYNEARLTCYDFETGAVISRIELGEVNETGYEILGITEGKLWMYSTDKESGFHSRNPKTLEVVEKESDFAALKSIQPARPEYHSIRQYYNFDHTTARVILTDMQGARYLFDPATKKAEPTELEMPRDGFGEDYLENTAYFGSDSFVSFQGDGDRKRVTWKYEDSTAADAFTKPEVFVDKNPGHILKRQSEHLAMLQSRCEKLKARFDSLGVTPDENGWVRETQPYYNRTDADRAKWELIGKLQYEYADALRDLEHEKTFSSVSNFDKYALSEKKENFIVYSASSVSDTAGAVLTSMTCSGKKFIKNWQLSLSGFYYNPDEAEGAGVFEEGDPEFRYRWADVHNNRFVMIAQLKMICIDLSSGKKLWEIQL